MEKRTTISQEIMAKMPDAAATKRFNDWKIKTRREEILFPVLGLVGIAALIYTLVK